eukprot:COSAG06_NODE_41610_length_389_cov_1.262069_1_plen_104_part_01
MPARQLQRLRGRPPSPNTAHTFGPPSVWWAAQGQQQQRHLGARLVCAGILSISLSIFSANLCRCCPAQVYQYIYHVYISVSYCHSEFVCFLKKCISRVLYHIDF